MLIDTHCHLDFPEFRPDLEKVIIDAKASGVAYIVNIGSSLQGSLRATDLAKKYDSIYAAVGLHPHEADSFSPAIEAELKELAQREKVVAIGETGLDYYKNYSSHDYQKVLFRWLIGLAKSLSLPLVIHNRQAEDDTLAILKENMPVKAVIHCFSGEEKFLKACLELGFFISFTCNITYKKAQNLRELVKITPLERLMLETDAPFLPPEGLRGKRNEPAYVKMLAEEIGKIKKISFEEAAEVTTANAKSFFKIQDPVS